MQKNNLIFIIISLAFLPIAYYGGTYIRNSIYGEKVQSPAARSVSEVGDVILTDHGGKPFQFSNFGKEYLLVFFGYTHCPDFCPTALSDITTAMKKMGPGAAEKVKIAFITFDPKRDSAEQLATYLKNFYPGIVGLTGTEEEIAAAASRFGTQYRVNQQTKSADGAKYDFEHSLSYFLVDAKGKIADIFRYSEGPEKLTEGLQKDLDKKS